MYISQAFTKVIPATLEVKIRKCNLAIFDVAKKNSNGKIKFTNDHKFHIRMLYYSLDNGMEFQ